ncbi:hypothetical protein [Hoylesella saccharolytica]|uniref:hypothetical protein n=1 Tax=Hoylesella saccharolytica TaxID=633701 RepID=UPI0028E29D29|nr:hypothetical protein [Hoylesella saccharolytica]
MKKNLFYITAFALLLAGCSQNDVTEKKPDVEKQGTAFVGIKSIKTGASPLSRTSLDYDRVARTLTYYWEPNDRLFLDDDNSATTEITAKAARASFIFESGTYNAPNYTVYYTGSNGTSHNAVTIATTQTQSTPNTTTHVGTAGDCGTGTATRQSNSTYTFTLDHKASFICFLPRTTNAAGTGWVLTSIKVTSDNNIAGGYTLSATGLTGTGSSNTITLNTGNFDITNNATDQARNAAYMVIAPGTHQLTVEYNVRNTVSGNTGTITKTLAAKAYDANTIYPITAHLFEDYSGTKYYLWDAQEDMWFGKTAINYNTGQYNTADAPKYNYFLPPASQPDFIRLNNSTAPEIPGWTMQWGAGNKFYYAVQSAAQCPNIFEIAWIYDSGDVRWDGATPFAFRGTIYRGGAWIKKLNVIAQENSTTVAALKNTYPGVHDGTNDLVHPDHDSEKPIVQGMPPIADINKYFYVPALGQYAHYLAWPEAIRNTRIDFATKGIYTCSTAYERNYGSYQWSFEFDNAKVKINTINYASAGIPLWKAQ